MTAQERLDLGMSYLEEGRFDEAIAVLKTISSSEDPEVYAQAQFNLGVAYRILGKLDEAIKAWSNVPHSNNSDAYAKAQLNLGAAYYAQNKLDQAIKTWSNITRDDDPETYARAQFNLGTAHKNQDELDEAITAWSKIRREEIDSKNYARAQLNLGAAYAESDKLDEAITVLSKIRRGEIDSKTYAWAQLNLGAAYAESDKLDQAIKTWSNITRDDNPEAYVEAQLCLGEVYSLDKEKEELAHEAYDNVRDFSYYKSERGFKILKCPVTVRKNLHNLAKNTDEVLKSLQIIPEFESKVAHYSRASTAFNIFGGKKNSKDRSNFRLNTIRGVNDPTEGLVLSDYWNQQGITETIHTNDNATFISCFTFNHDSLNQFRLYGKENDREATGVSLVFKKEFFSDQSDTLEFIADPSIDLSNKTEQIKSNETGKTESDNKNPLIAKSALYRCIYLDPKTGYWTLAQRDKSTFYRENKEIAENNWKKYSTKISKIKKSFKDSLFDNDESVLSILKSVFKYPKLRSVFKYPNAYNVEEKQKILEAVRFILLPLQYMVKHIAFQEEQECRIMYTTHLHDEKICHDWEKQQMYVEYEEPVTKHIDKIYLSPGAAKYQDHFRILLDQGSGKSKVRISQNPFRNKE